MNQFGNEFIAVADSPELSKADIRQKVWLYLEDKNIADFPRPVYNRIPNFKGASLACDNAAQLDDFKKAKIIKVNPDKPQEQIRFLALESQKVLLVPTPRLRSGLFNRIIPPTACKKEVLRKCAQRQGITDFSVPIGLNATLKIDAIVIGSVAVSKEGHRIGKGEGYADLEYAMMTVMGAISEETVVISTVHDCQIFDKLPSHLFGANDVTLDFIASPTQVIECHPRLPKPKGVIWSMLTAEKLKLMPILKTLRGKEQKAGKDTRLRNE